MVDKTLHDAAKQGDLVAIGAHLSLGTDVNAVDKLQRTPLHLAAWAGQDVRFCLSTCRAGARGMPEGDRKESRHEAAAV